MSNPTFDSSGYPTEHTCQAIEHWPIDDWLGLLEYLQAAWSDYGKIVIVHRPGGNTIIRFVTGGWSGNEELLGALRSTVYWACYWQSSHRGGLHVLRVPAKEATKA